jgi:uncharacterized protein HemX
MTKPLILMCVLLLTVIALGVGYMAMGQKQDSDAKRTAEIQACVRREVANLDRNVNITKLCTGR